MLPSTYILLRLSSEIIVRIFMKINDSLMSLYEKAHDMQAEKLSLLEQISAINLRYLNKSPAGEGAMKKILSIRDEITSREVAMAIIRDENPTDEIIENFLREAKITAALQHPNIVPVYDIGINQDKKPYFTMKLLKGHTLDEFIKNKPSIVEIIDIFKKICEGMAYAHSRGIIHLDLKPENIYVGKFGDVLICDWGLARILCSADLEEIPADDDSLDAAEVNHMTLNGQVKGTPGFMAPEQMSSKSFKDQQTDIFSLGALLYFMLSAQAPFQGNTFEEVRKKTLSQRPKAPENLQKQIPLSLQAIWLKAMEKKREQRYKSTNEIITEIDNYQQGFATTAEKAGLLRQLSLLIMRNKAPFLAAGIITVIIFGSLLLFIKQQEDNFKIVTGKEKAAREALEKFAAERTEKLKVQEDSSLRYFLNAEQMFRSLNFKGALAEVEKALLFNPNMQRSNALKAKILLSFYRIEEAIVFFEKADQHQKGFFRPLTDFCLPRLNPKTGRLNHDDYLTLVSMTPEPNTVVKFMMEDVFAQKMPITERVRLVKEILLIRNPEITQLSFDYEHDTRTLSLRKNPTLTNIDPLKFLPIKHLSLEGTAVTSLERIERIKLKTLNISKTYVVSLEEISRMPLESLNISQTGVTDLLPLMKMPLKKLNIIKTRIMDLSPLDEIESLTELKADWGKFPKQKKKFMRK